MLTGVGIDLRPENPKLKPEIQSELVREGAFEFNPARHDYGDKTFLGHWIKGRGMAEVEEALDILCHHPATATYLSRKIATYLVGDHPPSPLVQHMAETFRKSDGDINAVLSTLVRSSDVAASFKARANFMTTVHLLFFAFRMTYDDQAIFSSLPYHSSQTDLISSTLSLSLLHWQSLAAFGLRPQRMRDCSWYSFEAPTMPPMASFRSQKISITTRARALPLPNRMPAIRTRL